MMNTQTQMQVAGWPVRFRWVKAAAPGVNFGRMLEVREGYWLCDDVSGSVTMDHDGPSWSRPAEMTFVPFEDLTPEQMREAAKVAKRVALDLLRSIGQPVGEWVAPTDDKILATVAKARQAHLQEWAWNVAADQVARGEEVGGKAAEYLAL